MHAAKPASGHDSCSIEGNRDRTSWSKVVAGLSAAQREQFDVAQSKLWISSLHRYRDGAPMAAAPSDLVVETSIWVVRCR
jgi:hypothetical protein